MDMFFGDFSESEADQVDQSMARIISLALAAKASGDNELARRVARDALRQIQRNKDHPNRAFYLTIAKAINAHCFDRSSRAKLLMKRVIVDEVIAQAPADQALARAVVATCQIALT